MQRPDLLSPPEGTPERRAARQPCAGTGPDYGFQDAHGDYLVLGTMPDLLGA